jgi:hypothetical protein
MLPGQLEGDRIMAKSVTITVNPIMTAQAILPISQQMGLHEIRLDLLVAGYADGLVKFGIAIDVTGTASKGRAVRLDLVGDQRISEGIVFHVGLG